MAKLRNKNKILVIGSAHQKVPEFIHKICIDFAQFIYTNDFELITGACSGIPYIIGKKLISLGGLVTGYSPGRNEIEHKNIFNFTKDGCSNIIYIKEELVRNQAYLLRSMQMLRDVDLIVSIYGNWGTINELVCSSIFGKTILNAQFTGGASKIFPLIVEELGYMGYGFSLINAKNETEFFDYLNKHVKNL